MKWWKTTGSSTFFLLWKNPRSSKRLKKICLLFDTLLLCSRKAALFGFPQPETKDFSREPNTFGLCFGDEVGCKDVTSCASFVLAKLLQTTSSVVHNKESSSGFVLVLHVCVFQCLRFDSTFRHSELLLVRDVKSSFRLKLMTQRSFLIASVDCQGVLRRMRAILFFIFAFSDLHFGMGLFRYSVAVTILRVFFIC